MPKARLWLKNLRERENWTLDEVAKKLNFSSRTAYHRVEAYGVPKILDVERVLQISQAFNVSPEWVISEDRKWRKEVFEEE